MCNCKHFAWLLVVLRINVDSAIFQPYIDLEAGDNHSLKIQVARPGIEPGPLAPQAKSLTTRPPLLPQTLCITRVIALCTKCLHRPIVIINQQYVYTHKG